MTPFYIEMTDSPYSRDDVEAGLQRAFGFIEKFTGEKFFISDDEPTGHWQDKVVRFGNIGNNIVALAARGIIYDPKILALSYSPKQFAWLTLHEMGHVIGLNHVDFKESVMSVNRWRARKDKSMFWHADLVAMGCVDAHCSIDEDLSIMIPAIEWSGEHWAVRLRKRSKNNSWEVDTAYRVSDELRPMARFVGNELHMFDACFCGRASIPIIKFEVRDDAIHLINPATY